MWAFKLAHDPWNLLFENCFKACSRRGLKMEERWLSSCTLWTANRRCLICRDSWSHCRLLHMHTMASVPQNYMQRRVTIPINTKLILHLVNYKTSLISVRLQASWGWDGLVCLSCRALIILWVLTANRMHVNLFWCGFLPLQTREESHTEAYSYLST